MQNAILIQDDFIQAGDAGNIDQGVYVALVLMSLLTTIITPIVYRNWFYRGEYGLYSANGTCISDPSQGERGA